MKSIEIIWFDSISIFDQPVLNLSILKISIKQLAGIMLSLFIGLALKDNLVLALILASIPIALTFIKIQGYNLFNFLIGLVGFYARVYLKPKPSRYSSIQNARVSASTSKDMESAIELEDQSRGLNPLSNRMGLFKKSLEKKQVESIQAVRVDREQEGNVEFIVKDNILHIIPFNLSEFYIQIADDAYALELGNDILHLPKVDRARISIEIESSNIKEITLNRLG